jgi:hypothetical protein
MNVEVLKRVLKEAQRDERHNTIAETRYWCDQYKAIAEHALAALVREGWKPVPEDPTEAMVRAVDRVDFTSADTDGTTINVWHAMLAAAPKPGENT